MFAYNYPKRTGGLVLIDPITSEYSRLPSWKTIHRADLIKFDALR